MKQLGFVRLFVDVFCWCWWYFSGLFRGNLAVWAGYKEELLGPATNGQEAHMLYRFPWNKKRHGACSWLNPHRLCWKCHQLLVPSRFLAQNGGGEWSKCNIAIETDHSKKPNHRTLHGQFVIASCPTPPAWAFRMLQATFTVFVFDVSISESFFGGRRRRCFSFFVNVGDHYSRPKMSHELDTGWFIPCCALKVYIYSTTFLGDDPLKKHLKKSWDMWAPPIVVKSRGRTRG